MGVNMKVCLLSSGSIGNAIVIESEHDSILIDCGLSFKKFLELMDQTSLDPDKLKDVLVTHEHTDHSKSVGVCVRKLGLGIWATQGTEDAMYQKKVLREGDAEVNIIEKYKTYEIAGFTVIPFPLSHDAAEPVGFIVERDEKKVVYLTDTGYVSREVMEAVKDADLYMMEMNHNVEMLHMCDRPWNLKQRILGDDGHLSNEDGAYVLSKIVGENTKHVFLSHISQDVNLPELAMMTLKEVLNERKVNVSKLHLHLTYPLQPSHVVEV